jgi:hypothetical protein
MIMLSEEVLVPRLFEWIQQVSNRKAGGKQLGKVRNGGKDLRIIPLSIIPMTTPALPPLHLDASGVLGIA